MSRSSVGIESRRQTKAGRMYDIEGDLMPSVTGIISTTLAKPALQNWIAKQEREHVIEQASKLYGTPGLSLADFLLQLRTSLDVTKRADRTVRQALEIGTQAHQWIEWETRRRMGQVVGRAPDVSTPAQHAVAAWADWWEAHAVEPELVEQVVYSRRHRYAGTLDLIARVDGRRLLVDYKTASGGRCYRESHLQSAAYQAALDEMGHGRCDGGLVIVLGKLPTDPPFTVHEVRGADQLLEVFLCLRRVWQWMQDGDGR